MERMVSGKGEHLTVKDALECCGRDRDNIDVIFRTYGPNDEDLFAGYCRYENGELIPLDKDTYSLNDKIIDWILTYNIGEPEFLTVWYESEWI